MATLNSRPAPKAKVKGKSGSIKNISTKKGIGEKRISNLKKAFKNRERRAKYWAKKLNYENLPMDEIIQKLSQKQYLTPVLYIDFNQVKTVKEYNQLMRLLNIDKTKKFKVARTYKMRDWLSTAISRTINIEEDTELFNRINSMSDVEIAEFAMKNANLIATVFEYYKGNLPSAEERDALWLAIRDALGLRPLTSSEMNVGYVL